MSKCSMCVCKRLCLHTHKKKKNVWNMLVSFLYVIPIGPS